MGFLDFLSKKRQVNRIVLSPKKEIGPESSLKEFPLLYLYFDYFSDIVDAVRERQIMIAIYDGNYSINQVLKDEGFFLELYRNDMLRIKVNDGQELYREAEQKYWNTVEHPEKHMAILSSSPTNQIEQKLKEITQRIDDTIQALKLRYQL